MRYIGSLVLTTALCCSASTASQAQEEPAMMDKGRSGVSLESHVEWSMCSQEGVAVGGYDLISYRRAGGPVAGTKEFSTEHDGTTYLFASQENLDTFSKDPDRYVPAYSGFCAVTLALGRVTCPEYTNFKIEDDRLLLFEVTGFTNGRTLWDSNPADFRQKADTNFGSLLERQ